MRSALLLAAAVILVRDPTGKWAGDPLQPWFESLRNKLGLYCCAKADGNVLDDGEWDIKGNNYRVFVQGRCERRAASYQAQLSLVPAPFPLV
jgi:hypothetical protein